MEIVPIERVDADAVEALLDRAFGADRRGRTAYRLREGAAAISGLSLAAVEGEALIGTIQCWPVTLAGDDGAATPMVLIGPVAVEPDRQQAGVGRALMDAMLAAASDVPGGDALMMVGDPAYYGRFFGFTADRTGRWRLPGPFEPRRLLARGDAVPDRAGIVEPRFEKPSDAILRFVTKALHGQSRHQPLSLGRPSAANVALVIDQTGLNIDGWDRLLESSDVRHTFASHGNALREQSRGQLPIVKKDLTFILRIVEQAQTVYLLGAPHAAKLQRLEYHALFDGTAYVYVEQVRPGGKIVALKTMRKSWKG